MLEGQQQLGEVMVSSYKNEAANSLVNVFLASDSLESFIRNVTYTTLSNSKKLNRSQSRNDSLKNSTPCLKSLISKRTIKKSLLRRLKPKKNKLSKWFLQRLPRFHRSSPTRTCRGAAKSSELDDLEASAAKT